MKKLYQMPEAEICVLSNEDVIATSSLIDAPNTGYFDGSNSGKTWGEMFK